MESGLILFAYPLAEVPVDFDVPQPEALKLLVVVLDVPSQKAHGLDTEASRPRVLRAQPQAHRSDTEATRLRL